MPWTAGTRFLNRVSQVRVLPGAQKTWARTAPAMLVLEAHYQL